MVKRASAKPTILANLTLPQPGKVGSLSSNNRLDLDCNRPFVSRIWSTNGKVFERYRTNEFCVFKWKEAGKITALDGNGHPNSSILFGCKIVSCDLIFFI